MSSPAVSVIINTAPDREENLIYCLKMLCQQSFRDFEVIVVDDGSAGGETAAQPFQADLTITYDWRPNEHCVSRSRNRGAQLAKGERLVFIDSDILLNPDALKYYAHHLKSPAYLLYGYVGHCIQAADSLWFPEKRVNWLDFRFIFHVCSHYIENKDDTIHKFTSVPGGKSGFMIFKNIFENPAIYGAGGSFAIYRKTFLHTGGFDEGFVGHGWEDLEFCFSAMKKGLQAHFTPDVWGEHQQHERRAHGQKTYEVHEQRLLTKHPHQLVPQYPVLIFRTESAMARLETYIEEHYMGFLTHNIVLTHA